MSSPDSTSPAWFLLLIFSLLFSLVCGLFIIWMSINRSDIAWEIRESQRILNEKHALRDKLEVERDRLLSPDALRREAERLGMAQASPGQLRRLQNTVRSGGQ